MRRRPSKAISSTSTPSEPKAAKLSPESDAACNLKARVFTLLSVAHSFRVLAVERLEIWYRASAPQRRSHWASRQRRTTWTTAVADLAPFISFCSCRAFCNGRGLLAEEPPWLATGLAAASASLLPARAPDTTEAPILASAGAAGAASAGGVSKAKASMCLKMPISGEASAEVGERSAAGASPMLPNTRTPPTVTLSSEASSPATLAAWLGGSACTGRRRGGGGGGEGNNSARSMPTQSKHLKVSAQTCPATLPTETSMDRGGQTAATGLGATSRWAAAGSPPQPAPHASGALPKDNETALTFKM
mmetsp:Transcript_82775/g.239207  ORF Transcript_82775/g.239207 Transcript_82775/m.239207 type:complete len:305 (-) Transcript_82775:325-1239(-)